MADKTNSNNADSDAQQSSEELFLRGSEQDHVLRDKTDNDGLKLDDSQEELALQNILQGSEQGESPNKGVKDQGAGNAYDDSIEIESASINSSTDGSAIESTQGDVIAGELSSQTFDHQGGGNNTDSRLENNDQDTRRVLANSDDDLNKTNTGPSFTAADEAPLPNPTVSGTGDIPIQEDNSDEFVEPAVNSAPVAGDAVERNVDEGDSLINGQVTATDEDSSDALSYQVTGSAPDGFQLSSDGSWQFDAQHESYDHLNVGDSIVVSVPVVVIDSSDASDTTFIQITIYGTNDAPVAGAEISAVTDEGATTISGQFTSTDVDDGASASFTVSDGAITPDGFVLNVDGSYSFDPSDSAYDYLNVGDSEVITIPVTVTDDNGATDTSQIQITVTGTNDAPVAGAAISVILDEGSAFINGQLTSSDVDDGASATFTVSTGNSVPAGFVLNADGSYSFDPTDSAYDNLNVGDSEIITIPVTVTDENGATDTSQIQITISGTNDAPVAGASITTDVSEGASVINGQLTSTDLDDGATATFSISAGGSPPNGFVLNVDGSYSFDPADSAYDNLNVGNSVVLTVPITVTDDNGATDITQVQIIVVGTNDAPVAGANVAVSVDEGAATINSQLTSSDLDDGATATFAVSAGSTMPDGFVLNADGSYSFDPADTAYDHLNVGDSEVLTIPVTVTDDNGASDSSQIQITVIGTNDAPTAIVVTGMDVDENSVAGTVVATLSANDVDDGETFSYSLTDASGLFEISGDQIVVKSGADIDFESSETHDISVQVTDSNGATYTENFTINVNDINENLAPDAVDDISDIFVPENASLTAEINFDNGTPTASLGSVTTEVNGQVGNAADFSSAKVETSGLNLNGDVGAQTTVSMWIQANPEGGWEMLAASDRYDMVMLNGDIGFNTARGDLFGTDASELDDGEWHQIVGVFTNGDVTQNSIYIDGVEQPMSQIRGTPNNNVANIDSSGGSMFFGSWGANNNYRFSGSMDEVKVYDGVLSNDEVTQLYDLEADNLSWNGGSLSTAEDSALVINPDELLANDTDPDGDTLVISSVQDADNGSVEIDTDGNVVFTPDADYYGEASFTYTISDGNGGEDTATVTLNVSSVNDLPTIDVVNTITVDEDGSQQFNYSTADIDSSDVVLSGDADNGTVVINADGTATFTPDADFYGDGTITLTATDSDGGVTTQQISVTVNPVEDAPNAVDDGNFQTQSATLTAEFNFDSGVPAASVGSVSIESDGQIGNAADFSSAKVEASGLSLNGDVGAQTTVSMWIQANPEGGWEMLAASDRYDMVMLNGDIGFNTARGDLFGTDASELADGEWHQIVGVFTNGDVSQNSIYIDGVEQPMSQIRGTPNNSVANIDSSNGSMYFGSWGANNNYRFGGSMDEVKVFDGVLSSDEINSLYDIEAASTKWDATTLSTSEDTALVIDPSTLLANDIDIDGDTLSIVSVQDAQNGSVEIDADGNIVFTPAENYNGETTFSYTIDDGKGNTDTATVTLNVEGTNDAPDAGADVSLSVDESAALITGQLVATDVDGVIADYAISVGSSAPDGFVLNADGSYSFDPADSSYDHLNVGDSEILTIPVTVTDDAGASDTVLIQITISGANDAPVASAIVATNVDENAATISGQFTATDVDDGATATWSTGSVVAGFVLNADGSYSFDPADSAYDYLNAGDSEVITIPVTVTDENGAADITQIQITVSGTNDAPVAGAAVSATVDEGGIVINGQLTSSDVDDGATATYFISDGSSVPDGFVLNTDGSYSFDPADSAYDSLNVGDSIVLTVPVTITDDNGATDTTQIQITVSGTNDAPVAGAAVTSTVNEGEAVINGQLTSTDTDDGAAATFAVSVGSTAPDGFIINADGSYSFDPGDSSYDHLSVGDSEVITIPVTVTDDNGATDTAQIQITISGTNDAPVAGASISTSVNEGASVINGQLISTDPDDGATATFSISAGSSAPNGFVLNADGSYSFDPADSNYDGLNVGDSVVLTIPVTVTDDNGATDISQIQITVSGTNDSPVAGAAVTANVNEGDAIINGQLTSSDVDAGAMATFSITSGSAPDGFVLNADGSYSFNPADNAYDHLNVGDSAVLTIPITVTDDNGATDTSQIQITVSGTNDAPIAGADITTNVAEGAASINGQLTSSDIDDGASAAFTVSAGSTIPDGFVLNTDGSYSFDPADSAYNHLNVGDSEVITIPVTVTDDNGATDASQIQITISGTNDVPVAGASVTTSVDEGSATINGQLTSSDADDGAIAIWSTSSAPAGFVLNADGLYSFNPTNGAYDHLNVGDSEVITIPVTVTDDNGATDTSQIQITISGTNDAPIAGADVTSSVVEGSTTISGQLTSTDLDDGATATWSASSTPAGFVLNVDGSYSFNPADSAYDGLNVGDSSIITIPVTVTDENGAADTSQIQITVTGTNDAPVAGAAVTINVDEGTATINGQLTSSDDDAGATATWSASSAPAGFVLNVDGSYSFDPGNSAYDYLNVGDSEVVTIPVTVTDENGATDTSQIQLTISGTNDAPVADAAVSATVDEGDAVINGQLTSSDIDDGATATFTVTTGNSAPAGFVLNADGSYSFDPADSAYNHLNVGDSEVITIPVTVTDDNGTTDTTQVQVTISGTNDAPIAGVAVTASVDESSAVISGQITSSDADDGSTAVYSISSGSIAPDGFIMNADGSYSFDPAVSTYDYLNVGDNVVLTIPVTVTDDNGATDTTQIEITVQGTNDSPVVQNVDLGSTNEDNSIVITEAQLLANSSDADAGATLSVDSLTLNDVSQGALTDNGDGTWNFNPANNYSADDVAFNFTVTDGVATNSATAVIDIIAVADAPTLTATPQAWNGTTEVISVTEGSAAVAGGFTISVDGWQTTSDAIEQRTTYSSSEGDWHFELNTDAVDYYPDAANIYQDIQTHNGASYELSFDFSARPGIDENTARIEVLWDGVVIDTVEADGSGLSDTSWSTFNYTLTGDGDISRLEFREDGVDLNYGRGGFLDNISLTETSSGFTATGDEDTAILLPNLSMTLNDTDGSESGALTISDIPVGTVLSDGTSSFTASTGSTSVDITSWSSDSLTVTPPLDFDGQFDLTITATATEASNGDTSSTVETLTVNVVNDHSEDGVNSIYGTNNNNSLTGTSEDDYISGRGGNDTLRGGAGDDVLTGGSGNDTAFGEAGNDTYVMNPFDGSDTFSGGDGGGWIDVIDISAMAANDPTNPWTIEVSGVQVEYDLAAGALELNPDTAGVISFSDGSELTFNGVEKIEW